MRRNLPLKIVSLVTGILLWVFVMTRGGEESLVEAELEFIMVPPGNEAVYKGNGTLVVLVMGHERFLKRLREGDVRVVVDASGFKKGRNRVALDSEDVKAPFFIRALDVKPALVEVYLRKDSGQPQPPDESEGMTD